MALTILIPAAGSSTRMLGGDKLLELVAGEPMLRRQARIAREVCATVIVTLRLNDQARLAILEGLDVVILHVADADVGMSASLRSGAACVNGAMMVLPADMPEIDRDDTSSLINNFNQAPESILRGATATGFPGHPVIFPPDLLSEFSQLQANEGARSILEKHKERVRLFPLPHNHAVTDLDTPEAWTNWRANQV
jgi:molybdenum cofactor cytidylyltransferase